VKKVIAVFALALAILVSAPPAHAQKPEKIPRIGLLGQGRPSRYSAWFKAFRLELRERGYVERRNIRFVYRYADGKNDRLPSLAAELMRLKVDVMVTTGTPSTRAAMKASPTIPIVMSGGTPVEAGLVASLAHPGGNVTGVTTHSGGIYGKRLELLKEIVPSASRVAVLWNPANTGNRTSMKNLQLTATALGVKLLPMAALVREDINRAFAEMKKEHPGGLLQWGGLGRWRRQIIDFAAKNHLSAIYSNGDWVNAGGLMTYGPDRLDIFRRKAIYVEKILKGAKPADLPVERPRKFDLIINLKTAKKLGITIPPEVLFQATKVIK
jgi:putative ABC transport system substrate-binding protein